MTLFPNFFFGFLNRYHRNQDTLFESIKSGKLNTHIHYQTKSIELEKGSSGASYYCEKHAILVHFRSNQKSSIDYLDPDSEYKLMTIYRIYLKLIELTEQAVLWCKLQSSILLLSQVIKTLFLFCN